MTVGGHKVTLYSLDEVTWSSNPDEPLQLQSRQEEGRLQLQVKVQAAPKEKHSNATRVGSSNDEFDEEKSFEESDDELKEEDIDGDLDDLDDDEDEDDLLPVKVKGGSSAPEKTGIPKKEVKTGSVMSKSSSKAPDVSSEDTKVAPREKKEKEKKALDKEISIKADISNGTKKTKAASKTSTTSKVMEKKVALVKVVPATPTPKAKAAKGKAETSVSTSKPIKKSPSSAKKIEAPQKGKAVKVKVSPSKGKSPGRKGQTH
jgi:hypothetical protein